MTRTGFFSTWGGQWTQFLKEPDHGFCVILRSLDLMKCRLRKAVYSAFADHKPRCLNQKTLGILFLEEERLLGWANHSPLHMAHMVGLAWQGWELNSWWALVEQGAPALVCRGNYA